MRIRVTLDDALVAEAFRHTTARTHREMIEAALREFVLNHRRKNLRDLRGKIRFYPGYDYKALRVR